MTRRIKYHYEVIGWDDARPNCEAYHSNCTTKREALRVATAIKGRFDSIEVNRVAVDAGNPENYLGVETIANF